MANYYPPVGFYFGVEFSGVTGKDADTRFQSVGGLSVDLQTESFKEGGENRFEHVVPVRSKYQNITLKRGLVTDSDLITWCTDAFENLIIDPVDMYVDLLNKEGDILLSWCFTNAWPKKWSVSDLNAEQSAIAIETLEIQYQYFTLI